MFRNAYRPTVSGYTDRIPFILERCRSKRVLDVGVVGNVYGRDGRRERFVVTGLHTDIRAVAAHAIGVDPSPAEMPVLIERHPEMDLRMGDVECLAETIPVEQVDLVVLGDVLEHLSNPGRALDSIAPFLAGGGQLLATCPNAYGGPNWLRFLLGHYRESPTHVTAHTKLTLANLFARHGYRIDEAWTCLDTRPSRLRSKLLVKLGMPVLRRVPDLGGTLLVVASLDHRPPS